MSVTIDPAVSKFVLTELNSIEAPQGDSDISVLKLQNVSSGNKFFAFGGSIVNRSDETKLEIPFYGDLNKNWTPLFVADPVKSAKPPAAVSPILIQFPRELRVAAISGFDPIDNSYIPSVSICKFTAFTDPIGGVERKGSADWKNLGNILPPAQIQVASTFVDKNFKCGTNFFFTFITCNSVDFVKFLASVIGNNLVKKTPDDPTTIAVGKYFEQTLFVDVPDNSKKAETISNLKSFVDLEFKKSLTDSGKTDFSGLKNSLDSVIAKVINSHTISTGTNNLSLTSEKLSDQELHDLFGNVSSAVDAFSMYLAVLISEQLVINNTVKSGVINIFPTVDDVLARSQITISDEIYYFELRTNSVIVMFRLSDSKVFKIDSSQNLDGREINSVVNNGKAIVSQRGSDGKPFPNEKLSMFPAGDGQLIGITPTLFWRLSIAPPDKKFNIKWTVTPYVSGIQNFSRFPLVWSTGLDGSSDKSGSAFFVSLDLDNSTDVYSVSFDETKIAWRGLMRSDVSTKIPPLPKSSLIGLPGFMAEATDASREGVVFDLSVVKPYGSSSRLDVSISGLPTHDGSSEEVKALPAVSPESKIVSTDPKKKNKKKLEITIGIMAAVVFILVIIGFILFVVFKKQDD